MRTKEPFRFHRSPLSIWEGRYGRIPGDMSVFRIVHRHGRPVVQVYMKTVEGKVTCEALESEDLRRMIAVINLIKQEFNGRPGGSFIINEFGQVLVPTMDHGRFLLGEISGAMLFRNLDTGDVLDLADDLDLRTGAPWKMPYVGTIYNVNNSSRIYYWDGKTNSSIAPLRQDRDLIHKVRNIRRHGPARILVNPYGIVLTKVPKGDFDFDYDEWEPVYVGRVDYAKWFVKEGS